MFSLSVVGVSVVYPCSVAGQSEICVKSLVGYDLCNFLCVISVHDLINSSRIPRVRQYIHCIRSVAKNDK